MLIYRNLYILGTSHISPESVSQVSSFITQEKPAIIALELDKSRIEALFHKHKPSLQHLRHLGIKGFLLNLLGHYLEEKLGKLTGVSPGTEMKTAILAARHHHLQLAVIDQPIQHTLKKLSASITWKEKFRFLLDLLKAPFMRKPELSFDLKKVPSEALISQLLIKTRHRYPSVYSTLITQRNKVMAKNLYTIMHSHPDKKILAIVGAGHQNAILHILKRIQNTPPAHPPHLNRLWVQ